MINRTLEYSGQFLSNKPNTMEGIVNYSIVIVLTPSHSFTILTIFASISILVYLLVLIIFLYFDEISISFLYYNQIDRSICYLIVIIFYCVLWSIFKRDISILSYLPDNGKNSVIS